MGKHKNRKNKYLITPETTNPPQVDYVKDESPIVYQRSKLKNPLNIRKRPDLTNKQKDLINLILDKDTRVVFISGPAGTAKSFTAILAALQLLSDKKVSDLIYIRSLIESADRSMGYLKGSESEKLHPYMQVLMDKLEELLPKQEVEMLLKESRVSGQPINFLRGQSFNAKVLVADEVQNYTQGEILTTLTRIGKFTKMLLCADESQSDIGTKSGFTKMANRFDDEASRNIGIHVFRFTEDDIVRDEIIKFIVSRTKNLK